MPIDRLERNRRMRVYYSKNRDRLSRVKVGYQEKYRNANRKLINHRNKIGKYGLSNYQYKKMKKQQENRCKICLKNRFLVIDHNHTTGKVRGLLCYKCNLGLGLFNESLCLFFRSILYLIFKGTK